MNIINGTTLTSCNGTLFDSGGSGGAYSANEDYTVTISPVNAGKVSINFISFDVPVGDFLKIYDGTTTGDPLIGTYDNSNIPTSIISTGGSLYFVWHSEPASPLGNGFEMTWTGKISVLTSVTQNISCFGASDGELTAIGSFGTAPYSYSWSNGAATAIIAGLNAATYFITVTDSKGCNISSSKALTNPAVMTAVITPTNPTCNNYTDGIITIGGAAGGTGPYTYSIDGGTSWAASPFNGLAAGLYNVKIKDTP
ncbi:MAG: hypothetical protein HY958_10450, partial [Bacteroidia bacterium]|nr:hypothetical protein [Bacteroidia bacterium]